MRSRPCAARARTHWIVALLVVGLLAASCGAEDGEGRIEPSQTSDAERVLDEKVAELDVILREAVTAIGLEPDAGQRDVVDNPCIGPGGDGKNVRYYFDEPSHDRGVAYLRALQEHWSTGKFAINNPLQDDGSWATFLAVGGEFALEGHWFPASMELAVGGSTPCID
jgi:hypothetical protein